jgi:hypothetical protein
MFKMKLLISSCAVVLAFALTSGTASIASAATTAKSQPIRVTVQGQEISFAINPVVINGKTYVEFRTLFEKLGYQVDYNAKTRTVKAATAAQRIQIPFGSGVVVVDNIGHSTTNSAGELKIVNNHTMIGVRFIAMLSRMNVDWSGKTRTITITEKDPSMVEQDSNPFGGS